MVVSTTERDAVAATAESGAPFVRLLGPPEVSVAGCVYPLRPERSHLLLAVLACSAAWVSRDRLAELFWPDRAPGAARSNLRNLLFTARALPIAAGLQIDPQGVRWPVATDLQQVQKASAAGDTGAALVLCRGPLLEGIEPDGDLAAWLAAERTVVLALWREVVLSAADANLPQAVAGAQRLLVVDPYDDRTVLAIARLLHRLHRPADAARLCREHVARVRNELGVEPSAAIEEFVDAAPVARAMPRAPSEISHFFGRTTELSEIAALLAQPECRLLTLIGAGGSGKTRLARQFAEDCARPWRWAALDSIRDSEQVGGVIAEATGATLRDAASAPTVLASALGPGPCLLVLDNCEHVLGALPLVAGLLRDCLGLRVLATSRVRLGVEGEWLLPIEGLSCARQDARESEAVRFFIECAIRVQPHFEPTPRELLAIGDLVALVAGNPLALELAASWVRALPMEEIVSELQQDIGLLYAGPATPVERHASLRASFEHSWRLLTERERDALARLAAFRGGFTREAAMHVADVQLPVLASLLDRSLLRYDRSGRYDRHPLIYQFTQRKLAEVATKEAEVRHRHAEFFARHLERTLAAPTPRRQRMAELRQEWENIRLATEWLARHAQWPALERCSTAISRDPSLFGNLDVGADWAGRILEIVAQAPTPPPPGLVAQIQADRLWLQVFLETPRRSHKAALAALASARLAANRQAELQVLRSLGHLARKSARNQEATACFRQALEIAHSQRWPREEAMLLDALAMVENRTGNYDAAFAHAQAALAINERIGSHEQRIYNFHNMGESRLSSEQPRDALRWLSHAVALAHDIEFEQFFAYAETGQALCHLALDMTAEARASAEQAKAHALRLADQTAAGLASLAIARCRLHAGDLAGAATETEAAVAEALRLDDGLVQVSAVPVAARVALALAETTAGHRWLTWLADQGQMSHDGAREARHLLADLGIAAEAAAPSGDVPDLAVVAREIVVVLQACLVAPNARGNPVTTE